MVGRLQCAPVVVLIAAAIGAARPTYGAQVPRHGGLYVAAGKAKANAAPVEVPLVASTIEATARGPLIEAVTRQRFTNTTRHVMEAVYVLPLPPDAAVSGLVIRHGETTIEAEIAPRAQAIARHEQAVAAGVIGALFEQERPDVFTQTITGIAPGETVEVELRWDAIATRRDGWWELAVPLVVAPRVVPGTATTVGVTGSGTSPDTDRASDASRVTPPLRDAGGAPTTFILETDALALAVASPTHDVATKAAGDGTRITIVDETTSRDVVVRWQTKGKPRGWIETDAAEGFVALTYEAPAGKAKAGKKTARRVVVVLDDGDPVAPDAAVLVGQVERGVLAALAADDRYAVRGAGGGYEWRAAARAQGQGSAAASGRTRDLAVTLAATRDALAAKDAAAAQVVLVTDGLVADDAAVIAAAEQLGAAVHVVGVGAAPNRALVHAIAAATGGTARFVVGADDATGVGGDVLADVGQPAAAPAIDWGGLEVIDLVPAATPRLGAGQAITILARTPKARAVRGKVGRAAFGFEVEARPAEAPGATSPSGLIARLWARARIAELIARGAPAAEISGLGMTHGLVTPYTAMIAVGTEVRDAAGTRRSVAVPVAAPGGMRWQEVFARSTARLATKADKLKGKDGKLDKLEEDDSEKQDAKKRDVVRQTEDVAPGRHTVKRPPADTDGRGGGGGDGPDSGDYAPVLEPTEPVGQGQGQGGQGAGGGDAGGVAIDADGVSDDEENEDASPRAPANVDTIQASGSYAAAERLAPGRFVHLDLRLGGGGVFTDETRAFGSISGRLGFRLGTSPLVLGAETSLWVIGSDTDLAFRGLVTASVVGLARGFLDVTVGTGLHYADDPAVGISAGVRLGRGRLGPTLRLETILGRDPATDRAESTTAVEAGIEASF